MNPDAEHMSLLGLCALILYPVICLCEMMCNHKKSIHNTLQGSVTDTMEVSNNIFSARYFQLSLQVKYSIHTYYI